MRLYGVTLSIVLVAGCGGGASDEPPEVDWENYAREVQVRILRMARAGDCAGLQNEFDVADQNDDGQRARTGDGNADLMGYIDYQMREAGCY